MLDVAGLLGSMMGMGDMSVMGSMVLTVVMVLQLIMLMMVLMVMVLMMGVHSDTVALPTSNLLLLLDTAQSSAILLIPCA